MKASPDKTILIYDRVIQACLVSILIFTPLALGANRLWAITPVYLVTLIALCAFLLKMISAGAPPFRWTPLRIPIFAFLILIVGSCIISVYPHASIMALYRVIIYLAIYYIIVNFIDSRLKLQRLVGVITITAALLSFIGLILYLGHFHYRYWLPGATLSSTYVNRNHFAGYLEMAMPLTAALLFTVIGKAKKVLVGFLFVMMIVAFVLAGSRAAWVSLLTSCLTLVPLLYRKKVLKKIFPVIIVCGILAFLTLLQFDLGAIAVQAKALIARVGDDDRIPIWLGVLQLIRAHPFIGTGIGTFVHVFPQATIRPSLGDYKYSLIDYAHNDYLQMTVELGFIGLLLIAWFIIGAIWLGLREFCVSEGSFKENILFGAVIGVMSMALHSFVDFNLHIPANAILFMVLVGIIMAMLGRRRYD